MLGIDLEADSGEELPAELVDLAREHAGYEGDDAPAGGRRPARRTPAGRAAKNWGVADAIRDGIAALGLVIEDTAAGRPPRLADIIRAAGEGDALVVVLDHVTDEGNFGAIVRSAEVVGAAGVVIANARAARVGVGAYKTSAGAVLHLPIAQVSNLATAIEQLKEAGFWVGGRPSTPSRASGTRRWRAASPWSWARGERASRASCSRSATSLASCRSAGASSRSTWRRPPRSCATSGCARK